LELQTHNISSLDLKEKRIKLLVVTIFEKREKLNCVIDEGNAPIYREYSSIIMETLLLIQF